MDHAHKVIVFLSKNALTIHHLSSPHRLNFPKSFIALCQHHRKVNNLVFFGSQKYFNLTHQTVIVLNVSDI